MVNHQLVKYSFLIKENLKEAFQNNEDASTWYRNFHDLSNYLDDEYGISKEKQKK